MGEDAVQAERSSAVGPHGSQELVAPSPSPAHSISPLGPLSPSLEGGQASAITVLTLLDKLVHMLDTVQDNQRKMEQRQVEMECAVRDIQCDVTRLCKTHSSTSNSVSKLLEKARKTSLAVKEVREKIDKQAVQVKKLEANHTHLLKRDNFKVLIFQEEREIPTSVFVKDSMRQPLQTEEETPAGDVNCSQEEGMQTISLSSDEEQGPDEDEDLKLVMANQDLASERSEWSRTERLKRSSLKKVDTLKKAFSRQSIEKKMNKIVTPEQREKLKKSFTPNHPKSPSSRNSSFKVSPLTFNVKKVREGQPSPTAVLAGAESVSSPDGEHTFTELQQDVTPVQEVVKAVSSSMEQELELTSPSAVSLEGELSVKENGGEHPDLSASLQQPDQAEEEEEEQEQKEEEKEKEGEASPQQNEIHVDAVVHSGGVAVE